MANTLLSAMINATHPSRIFQTAISDRPPVSQWSSEETHYRVILLGDAAHLMTPFMGQGANTAMIDAFIVCTLLAVQENSIKDVAIQYQDRRMKNVYNIVSQAKSSCNWMMSKAWWAKAMYRILFGWVPSRIMEWLIQSADSANSIDDLIEKFKQLQKH